MSNNFIGENILNINYQLVIIGAGPAGLFAAREAKRKNIRFLLLDTLNSPGGSGLHLFPDSLTFDPVLPQFTTNSEFICQLLAEINLAEQGQFHSDRVTEISSDAGMFLVKAKTSSFRAEKIMVAAGNLISGDTEAASFRPDDLNDLAGGDVVVYGGKHEAVGLVTEIATVANSVIAFSPCDLTRRALHQPEAALSMTSISWPWELLNLDGNRALFKNLETGENKSIIADFFIKAKHNLYDNQPFLKSGFVMQDNRIFTDAGWQTSIPGIMAIGPCSSASGGDPDLELLINSANKTIETLFAIE